jgi:hypothetical protein
LQGEKAESGIKEKVQHVKVNFHLPASSDLLGLWVKVVVDSLAGNLSTFLSISLSRCGVAGRIEFIYMLEKITAGVLAAFEPCGQ